MLLWRVSKCSWDWAVACYCQAHLCECQHVTRLQAKEAGHIVSMVQESIRSNEREAAPSCSRGWTAIPLSWHSNRSTKHPYSENSKQDPAHNNGRQADKPPMLELRMQMTLWMCRGCQPLKASGSQPFDSATGHCRSSHLQQRRVSLQLLDHAGLAHPGCL